MTVTRRRFLSLSAGFVGAVALPPASAHAASWSGHALGAEVSITLTGPRIAVEAALAAVPQQLSELEAQFSLYRSDSALTALNQSGRLRPAPMFHRLMRIAAQAHALTDGLFDPTVQPLWQALARGDDPEPARALIGFDRVALRPMTITLAPGQALTLNGIAQGFATDMIRDSLRAQDFGHALIDIGEQAAIGGPFRLLLEDQQQGAVGMVSLSDAARATSSPFAMRLGGSGTAEGHILGPRGETPIWSTISIESPSAAVADALSTAAVFMDRRRLDRLKHEAGLSRITVVDMSGDLMSI